MNRNKKQYVERIRSNTAYPTYRAIVRVIEILGYIGVAIAILGTLAAAFGTTYSSELTGGRQDSTIPTLVVLAGGGTGAILSFFMIRFLKEAAMMLADIADSLTEGVPAANSRSSGSIEPEVE